ncbi:hypothetical protein ACLK17_01860 [Escherichia coli]
MSTRAGRSQYADPVPEYDAAGEGADESGGKTVLLVPPQLRPLLARYARLFAPGLHVLSYNEVPDELELKIMGALRCDPASDTISYASHAKHLQ